MSTTHDRDLHELSKTMDQVDYLNKMHAKELTARDEEIKRLRGLLEDAFVAIGGTGANYDTFNKLRPMWETLRKELERKS